MPILSRVGTGLFLKSAGGGGAAEPGEAVFHADNGSDPRTTWNNQTTHSWTVPDGVTSISVVCVGGGGGGQPDHDGASGCGGSLAYKNNIAVTPGETVTVVVGGGGFEENWGGTYGMAGEDSRIDYDGTTGLVRGKGGARADKGQANGYISNGSQGSNVTGDGGGSGGSGVAWGGCRQGGGAAGGYGGGGLNVNGTPGNVQYSGYNSTSGTGGGGGGGGSSNGSSNYYSGGGGGTGIYGTATDGAGAQNTSSPGDSYAYCGKGGSADPWTTETNGLSVSTYIHYTGLRGYTNDQPTSQIASVDAGGSDLNNLYFRGNYTQGAGSRRPDGGFPGGGGGGGNSGSPAGAGGNGVVRIVWGTINSMTREFPNQGVNMTNQYPGLTGNTPTVYGLQRMY